MPVRHWFSNWCPLLCSITVSSENPFTHFLRFKSVNFNGNYCNICHTEKGNISFNYNREIFIICRCCTFEFIRITFVQLYSNYFKSVDNERTIIVYSFFHEFVFSRPFEVDLPIKQKFNFFQHPLHSTINQLPVEKRLSYVKDLASNRIRWVTECRVIK